MVGMSDTRPMLAVHPQVYRYSAIAEDQPGEEDLVQRLRSQFDTQPVMIHNERDVLLNENGLIQGEYRLTTIALSQLCKVLAPGLAPLLQSLSGLKRRSDKYTTETYSMDKAIFILNEVLKTRFEMLENRFRFIMDRRNKVIEGIVGPKYYFVANLDLYQRINQFVAKSGIPASFLEGALSGRRLQLRYKNTDRAFALDAPRDKMEPFYAGWHFSNSELGDCCIKGSSLIYRSWSRATAVQPYGTETKLIHLQGKDFDERLRDIFMKVKDRVERVPELKTLFESAKASELFLGPPPERTRERCKSLTGFLTKGGIRKQIAEEIVSYATTHGSYRAERISMEGLNADQIISPDALKMISHRTVYDVFSAMIVIARRYHPEKQETLEQAAHDVLTKTTPLFEE